MPEAPTKSASRPSRPGIVTILAASLLLLLLSHPLIHGDGVAYLIYLDSLARDGDFDLSNQVVKFAPAIAYPFALSTVTGTPVTPFPFGSASLLAPFYQLGRGVEPLLPALRAYPEHFRKIQGLSLAFSLLVALGAHLYALAAVGLSYRAARCIAPGWAAGLAAICCLVGTPLLYYSTVEPLDAHVYGSFAIALALWLAVRGISNRQDADTAKMENRASWGRGGWQLALAIGLALGLAVLVRWQLLLYALPIGVALVLLSAFDRRQPVRIGLAFAVGLGMYCGVCTLYFWRFFGAPLVIPNDVITGQQFVGAPLRYLPQVLLARHNGWLSWSPVAALGLIGLAGITRARPGPWRALALAGLAGIALQLALNASLDEWYAGWAFGQRRMTEAYPLLVVGCAWLIGRGRWKPFRIGAVILCALYGVLLLTAHLYYVHTAGHPEGGGIAEVTSWLLSGPHGPTLAEVFRDRYGPWAWAKPEL
jgi:hypothetical protein